MNIKYLLAKLMLKIQVPAIKNSILDNQSRVASKATVYNTKLGKYSYVGVNTYVINAEVGSFCSIGNDSSIGLGQHPYSYVSTSPVFYGKNNIFRKSIANLEIQEYKRTIIGNDVWIGERVLIMDGVKIGTGAVIGAGTIVTHDVPPYAIVVGNPGKVIKCRFESHIINQLLESEWWELDEESLRKIGKKTNNVTLFLQAIKEIKR